MDERRKCEVHRRYGLSGGSWGVDMTRGKSQGEGVNCGDLREGKISCLAC